MQELEKNLDHLECPKNEKIIILTAIKTVRMNTEKPVSKEIMNSIYKELSRIVKNDD
jgi:hypothetical protein